MCGGRTADVWFDWLKLKPFFGWGATTPHSCEFDSRKRSFCEILTNWITLVKNVPHQAATQQLSSLHNTTAASKQQPQQDNPCAFISPPLPTTSHQISHNP